MTVAALARHGMGGRARQARLGASRHGRHGTVRQGQGEAR